MEVRGLKRRLMYVPSVQSDEGERERDKEKAEKAVGTMMRRCGFTHGTHTLYFSLEPCGRCASETQKQLTSPRMACNPRTQ